MDTTAEPRVFTFPAADGRELGCVVHEPHPPPHPRAAFLYLHGIESHAGWFDPASSEFNTAGHPVYCFDRRGSGINRENRGCPSGHVPPGLDLLDDLRQAIRHVRTDSRSTALYLVGLSWGGKYAMAYEAAHPGELDGLVLITPGLQPKVGYSLREKLTVTRDLLIAPQRRHPIPIEPEMFTSTPRHLDFIRRDPLRLHDVSAAFLWQSRRLDRLLARPATRVRAPMLVVLAGHDRIIDNAKTRRFLARHAPAAEVLEYPDQTHSIQLDAPERLVRDVLGWMHRNALPC
jgi:alpha-beta hydrolase superfamily lysophospholipase